MRILDRYIVRETLGPFLMALGIFTFLLAVRPVMEESERLLAKSVPPQTIGVLLVYLIPQALGITIPMALLAGLLMAFGRLSADRESVAFLACGVSYTRLLRPVVILATLAAAATLWVMVEAIPTGNRRWTEITFSLLTQRMESEIQPRVFFEDFPNRVLYIRDIPPASGWNKVFIGDTSEPGRPRIEMAQQGQLVIDRDKRTVDVVLNDGVRYSPGPQSTTGEAVYDTNRFVQIVSRLDPNSVFPPPSTPGGGPNNMTIPELRAEMVAKVERGELPHPQIIAIQQKFSFPVACYVLSLIALVVGMHTRREGKFAAFAVGIAVIFAYYVVMFLTENATKSGHFPAVWARWVPNILLGAAGLVMLWRRMRGARPILSHVRAMKLRRSAPAETAAPAASSPRRRAVLVVKFPPLALPRPTLLDLYIGNRYLRVLALTFFGLMGLFYVSTIIDLSEKLLKGQASSGMMVAFMIWQTPEYVYFVMPMAILLATLVTFGILTRTSELTIMRACGISLYRAAAPVLLLGMLASGALFVVQEKMLASGRTHAETLRRQIRGQSPQGSSILTRRWMAGRSGRIYHYGGFNPRARELERLSIFELDAESWRLMSQTFTPRVRFVEGTWVAEAGWVQTFPASGIPVRAVLPAGVIEGIEAPDYFGTEITDATLMSLPQLRQYVADLTTSGASASAALVEYHRKIAFPLVAIVMTLLAVPFAVTTGRRGALYGIGLGIALSIAYWFILTVFGAMGTAGVLPPMLAAWAPNLFFAAGAGYLLLTVRT
ncbi:MAG: LptF/LptG family permease [Acidobacteriota bacterium]|nr:LptF/LptG family permease [Acidobacteriota bacterium]